MRVVRQASSLGGARTQSVGQNNCSYLLSFQLFYRGCLKDTPPKPVHPFFAGETHYPHGW